MTSSEKARVQPYQVVARRYRPQAFGELIGQAHITQALSRAIEQQRVGHAYLFTGARGTGKTSTARIFAKCLNCVEGPTLSPCQRCDSCEGIAAGDDLDVIEIDGASNRGIDEIRQLRSNVGIRPSRSRYKIYIIDEVHMLTPAAFNALLKTLEEPPGHVKFFFCTTDPQKVPITVLSRCQRYDFLPVETVQIAASLARIAAQENVQVQPEALELLARRAQGSLRDSQSLLEQLLSFCDERITLDDVLTLLGIAGTNRVLQIGETLVAGDMARVLQEIDRAVQEGVEIGQLGEQLVGFCRDALALKVGCDPTLTLQIVGEGVQTLQQLAAEKSLDQWLAMLQILDQAVVQMQQSLHSRVLLEAACIRICQLEQLRPIGELLERISPQLLGAAPGEASRNSVPPPAAAIAEETAKKKAEIVAGPTALEQPASVHEPAAATLWLEAAQQAGGMTTEIAQQFVSIDWQGPHVLRVTLANDYHRQLCSRAERKERLERVLSERTGRTVRLDFTAEAGPPAAKIEPVRPNRREQRRQLEQHEWVRLAIALFDADVIDFRIGPQPANEMAEEMLSATPEVEEYSHYV